METRLVRAFSDKYTALEFERYLRSHSGRALARKRLTCERSDRKGSGLAFATSAGKQVRALPLGRPATRHDKLLSLIGKSGMNRLYLVSCIVFVVSACGGPPGARAVLPEEWHPATAMLEKYADKEGVVTRAGMERGLKADFATADTNHDGCLDENEARVINEARWKEDESAASPLIDFLHNGCIDFDEFAAGPRSLFEQVDRNADHRLTPQELHPGRKSPTGGP